MTGDWGVYSPPHTDEATGRAKRVGGYWNWEKGNAGDLAERGKKYTRGWLLFIYMKWPSPVGESCGRQVGPGGL